MMLVYFNLYYKVGLKAHAEHKNRKERHFRKESTTLYLFYQLLIN